MKYGLNKLLLSMLFPFLNASFGIVDDDGSDGGGNDGDAGDSDDADALAQKAIDDAAKEKSKGTTISDSEAKLLKDVMAKKKALKDATDNVTRLTEQLKTFDGIDPAAIKAMIQEKKDADTLQLEAKGNWDKLKTQMADTHKTEMTGALAKSDALQVALDEQSAIISELTVGSAFSNSAFIKDEVLMTANKTRAVYGAHFGFENGVIVGYDKPTGKSDRVVLVDSSGDPLNFEDALKKIVDSDPDRDHILRSKVKSGSGSKPAPKAKVPDTSAKTEETGRGRITSALSDFLKK